VLASKAATALSESFTYTPEQIEEKYQSYEGSEDYFDYAYAYVSAERTESTNADGETVSNVTEEALAAAETKANAIADTYREAKGDSPAVRLVNAAAAEEETGSQQTRIQGSSLPAAVSAWLTDAARASGDVSVQPDDNGCYVVVFLNRDDNHYNTVNVRHILVKAVADEEGNYSDEAKAAAKARAEEILAEYEGGDKTEERFAQLAEQYSEDTGSNTNGGLYENVAKGQMVQEFNDFCFAEHKAGDTGIVYGESGSYAGYHVMYYVGEGELNSNVIAETALRNDDANAWMEEQEKANPSKDGFGMKFVG
jgi:parvulin-like peptidyl-prolyl isomerase